LFIRDAYETIVNWLLKVSACDLKNAFPLYVERRVRFVPWSASEVSGMFLEWSLSGGALVV